MIKGKGEWLNLVNLEETSRLSQSQFSEFSKMFQGPAETILNIDKRLGYPVLISLEIKKI